MATECELLGACCFALHTVLQHLGLLPCSTVTAQSERGEVALRNPRADESEMPKVFTYDAAFGPGATQQQIYDITAAPIVGMPSGCPLSYIVTL